MIRSIDGKDPDVSRAAFIAPDASILGAVTLGSDASVWYHCVLRGDVHWIRIGDRSNIQDGTIVHTETGRCPAVIGNDVTVGHRVLLHGCEVGDGCLIGMGAILLSGCRIGAGSIIAAGAVVREGMEVPPASLVAGVPAVVKARLDDDRVARLPRAATHYVDIARMHARSLAPDPAAS